MTRFLFGTSGTGPENYDGAWDSMMKPLKVSHLKKIGPGQHLFGKQTGRLPLNRVGTRAAADGVFPSHWEPGMGYSETMNNEGKSVANFSKQPGRIELHLSGMRGAPPMPRSPPTIRARSAPRAGGGDGGAVSEMNGAAPGPEQAALRGAGDAPADARISWSTLSATRSPPTAWASGGRAAPWAVDGVLCVMIVCDVWHDLVTRPVVRR